VPQLFRAEERIEGVEKLLHELFRPFATIGEAGLGRAPPELRADGVGGEPFKYGRALGREREELPVDTGGCKEGAPQHRGIEPDDQALVVGPHQRRDLVVGGGGGVPVQLDQRLPQLGRASLVEPRSLADRLELGGWDPP
jgi:hypothetical protein